MAWFNKTSFRMVCRKVLKWFSTSLCEESNPQFFTRNKKGYEKYEIGDYTYGNPIIHDFNDVNAGQLIIGKFCSIAHNVQIFLSGNHRLDWISTYPFSVVFKSFSYIKGHPSSKGDVIIGNDVWIGANVIILSGISIGNGAVIAAGSVITKNVPPFSIFGGNPAKFIKYRFDQKTIKKLLEIGWWEKDIDWIKERIEILLSPNIKQLLDE